MALSARQITLVASTPTPLLVLGAGAGTTFKNISGTVTDLLPVQIKNEDAAAVVWIGGPDVSATRGQSLNPGQAMTMNVYGSLEIPYAFSAATPIVSILVGRQ
jgi:hypothetical protein